MLVAIVALISVTTWDRFNAAAEARAWSQHTYDVLGAIKDLILAVRNAGSGQRGYLLTGKDDYLAPYDDAIAQVGFLQGELQRLTADNALEQERLHSLAPILQHKLEELAQTVQLRRTIGLDPALAIVQTDVGRNFMKEIEATLAAMSDDEHGLLR